jgi:23S rRNA pseudouridine2605 synthase
MRRGTVRLDRALSKLGVASRAEARRLIVEGRVRIDGTTARDPTTPVVPETARISVGGSRVRAAAWRAIVLHKPRGVVTTRRDPEGRPTVFDLLGDAAGSLVAVGRLDLASTGLLLLTTDTRLADRLTDPAHAIVRRYVVTVRGAIADAAVDRMVAGVEGYRAHRVTVRKRSNRESHLIVELTEGKNREIRRLLRLVGHDVTRLKRIAFGSIELGTLLPGRWRELSRAEIARVFQSCQLPASSFRHGD